MICEIIKSGYASVWVIPDMTSSHARSRFYSLNRKLEGKKGFDVQKVSKKIIINSTNPEHTNAYYQKDSGHK